MRVAFPNGSSSFVNDERHAMSHSAAAGSPSAPQDLATSEARPHQARSTPTVDTSCSSEEMLSLVGGCEEFIRVGIGCLLRRRILAAFRTLVSSLQLVSNSTRATCSKSSRPQPRTPHSRNQAQSTRRPPPSDRAWGHSWRVPRSSKNLQSWREFLTNLSCSGQTQNKSPNET